MNRAFCPRTAVPVLVSLCLTSITGAALGQGEKVAPAPPKAETPAPSPAAAKQPAPTTTPAAPPAAASSDKPATEAPTNPAPPGTEPSAPAGSVKAEEGVAARPSPEQIQSAKQAFAAGEAAFSSGNFEEAVAKFREANAIIPTPHAEFWIAQAMDKQGKPPKEVFAAYELFLNHPAREHVGQEQLNLALSRAAEIKAALPASIIIETTPAGASVKVDGIVVPGTTPLEVDMDAGTHRIELSRSGYDTSVVELDAEAGARVRAPVELVKSKVVVAATQGPETQDAKRSVLPGWITLGLGGAGLISGTVFGILALDSKSQFDQRPTAQKADDAERNALIADMSFGIALTLGITGIVLLTTHDDGDAPPKTTAMTPRPKVHFAPFASATSGGAAISGSF